MNRKRVALATSAAAIFALGLSATAQADHHEMGEKGEKIKCEGVNSCKGHGECATASHDCGGKNACAGKGWVKMTKAECDAAKAKMKK